MHMSIIIFLSLQVWFLYFPKVLPRRVVYAEATSRVEMWPIGASHAKVNSGAMMIYSVTNTAVPPPFGFL